MPNEKPIIAPATMITTPPQTNKFNINTALANHLILSGSLRVAKRIPTPWDGVTGSRLYCGKGIPVYLKILPYHGMP